MKYRAIIYRYGEVKAQVISGKGGFESIEDAQEWAEKFISLRADPQNYFYDTPLDTQGN